MTGTTTWLAGKVASLVPNVLPSTTAAASSTVIYLGYSCQGVNCVPATKITNKINFERVINSSGSFVYSYEQGCCGDIST